MEGSPSAVDEEQLEELHLKLKLPKEGPSEKPT